MPCRTCLKLEAAHSLFEALQDFECERVPRVLEAIMALTCVQIEQNDGLSTNICSGCLQELKEAYNFKKKCERTDSILRGKDICLGTEDTICIKVENDFSSYKLKKDFIEDQSGINFCDVNEVKNNPIMIKIENSLGYNSNEKSKSDIDNVFDSNIDNHEFPSEKCINSLHENSLNQMKCEEEEHTREDKSKQNLKIGIVDSNTSKTNPLERRKIKFTSKLDKGRTGKISKSLIRSCPLCDFKTKLPSHMKVHMHIHTGEKPLACDICTFRCIKPSSLQNHKLIHNNEKPYGCTYCDYKSTNSSNLKRHVRKHTNDKPYSCELCFFRCAQSTYLKEHQRVHTGEKPFLCDQCHYTCCSISALRAHKRNKHSQEKKYACDECDFKTKSNSTLIVHKKNHAGIKNFACDLCSYKSIQLVALENHKRTVHSEERPFACDQCSYRSVNAALLKVHKRTHLTVKMFSCDECPYTCHTKFKLKTHKRTHTGEKPYMCNACDFKCASSSSLRRHNQRTHNLE